MDPQQSKGVFLAASLGLPIGIVNQGATRGDPLASVQIDAALGQVLPALYRSP